MADTKISALTAIVGADTATGDLFAIVDISTGATMKITRDELHAAIVSGFFASQAQAEAGTNNTAVMTPLRTAQAITALANRGLEVIASSDLSNDATVEFTGFDSSAYDGYLFLLQNVIPATDGQALYLRTSTDGGSTYDSGASAYAYSRVQVTMDSVPAQTESGSSGASQMVISGTVGSGTNEDGLSGTVWMPGPHLAKRTMAQWHFASIDEDNVRETVTGGGVRLSSADVDAVRFLFSSGNLESGTITFYGMRNA